MNFITILKMKILLAAILTLIGITSQGQTLKVIEQVLLKQINKITYWSEYNGNNPKINRDDSLIKANYQFQKNLLHYTSSNPATLSFAFAELTKVGVDIATSEDRLFRIYSWDNKEGGTMRFFNNVYQYKIGNKIFSQKVEHSANDEYPGSFYSNTYTLKSGAKTYYLSVYHSIFSTSDSYQGIKVFSIGNNALNDGVKLIKTKSGLNNTLGFNFDFFSVVDFKERPVILIKYNPALKSFSIPVVLENGEVTDKKIIYKFTGQYFELIK